MSDSHTLRLTPLAEIDVPLAEFRARGLRFRREQDDLDAYDIATFAGVENQDFAIQHYVSRPPRPVSLLVPDSLLRRFSALSLVEQAAAALGVAPELFQWRSPVGELMTGASPAPRRAATG